MESANLGRPNNITTNIISSGNGNLLVVEPTTEVMASSWIQENRNYINSILLSYGGLLLRNFGINSISEFNSCAHSFQDDDLLEYSFRSTPRKTLGGKIYTSTEYPAD